MKIMVIVLLMLAIMMFHLAYNSDVLPTAVTGVSFLAIALVFLTEKASYTILILIYVIIAKAFYQTQFKS